MKKDNIIEFPKEVCELRKNLNSQIIVSVPDVSYSRIITGDWSYTCPSCGEKIHFSSENMIFRTLETYCSTCGHYHKITNPSFTNNIKR